MNIGEIAQRAGVSRSTVSYVLSGKRQIGEATKARVMAIIDQANYRPSASARALSNGSTRTLALAVPRLHHHLSIEIMQFVGAIAEAAAEDEFDTLLSPSGRGERPTALERLVMERRVDGIILMETVMSDPRVEMLMAQEFPFITIGRAGHDDEHDWVDTDYAGLVREAVERLTEIGHQHIALVNRPQEMLDNGYCLSVNAWAGFKRACADLGVDGLMVCCEEEDGAGEQCLRQILDIDPKVTALVSVNDRSLSDLMDALATAGRSVPGDMSVIAVAPPRVAAHTTPPVTTADVPAASLAATAVRTLLARIDRLDTDPVRQLFATPFVDRGSIAPPKRTAGPKRRT